MKKVLSLTLALLFLLSFNAVLADRNGQDCWCNIDQYGCTITNENGGQDYIMFWTEEARQYIMGSLSAPYKNVVGRAEGTRPTLMCGAAATGSGAVTIESICGEWVDLLISMGEFSKAERSEQIGSCSSAYSTVEEALADFEQFESGYNKPVDDNPTVD